MDSADIDSSTWISKYPKLTQDFKKLDHEFIGISKIDDEVFAYNGADIVIQSTWELPIIVQWPDSLINFKFSTTPGDISFGIVFVAALEEGQTSKDAVVEAIKEMGAVPSSSKEIVGSFSPPSEGVVFFMWDNNTDWIQSNKKLSYAITVRQPSFTSIDNERVQHVEPLLEKCCESLDAIYNKHYEVEMHRRALAEKAENKQKEIDGLAKLIDAKKQSIAEKMNEMSLLHLSIAASNNTIPGLCIRVLSRDLLAIVLGFLKNDGGTNYVCKYWMHVMESNRTGPDASMQLHYNRGDHYLSKSWKTKMIPRREGYLSKEERKEVIAALKKGNSVVIKILDLCHNSKVTSAISTTATTNTASSSINASNSHIESILISDTLVETALPPPSSTKVEQQPPTKMVKIFGLTSPDGMSLNGKVGTVVGSCNEYGERHILSIDGAVEGTKEEVRIKISNCEELPSAELLPVPLTMSLSVPLPMDQVGADVTSSGDSLLPDPKNEQGGDAVRDEPLDQKNDCLPHPHESSNHKHSDIADITITDTCSEMAAQVQQRNISEGAVGQPAEDARKRCPSISSAESEPMSSQVDLTPASGQEHSLIGSKSDSSVISPDTTTSTASSSSSGISTSTTTATTTAATTSSTHGSPQPSPTAGDRETSLESAKKLGAALGISGNRMSEVTSAVADILEKIKHLELEKRKVKKVLKTWTEDFIREKGRAPTNREKKTLKYDLYEHYHNINIILKTRREKLDELLSEAGMTSSLPTSIGTSSLALPPEYD